MTRSGWDGETGAGLPNQRFDLAPDPRPQPSGSEHQHTRARWRQTARKRRGSRLQQTRVALPRKSALPTPIHKPEPLRSGDQSGSRRSGRGCEKKNHLQVYDRQHSGQLQRSGFSLLSAQRRPFSSKKRAFNTIPVLPIND